MDDGKQILAELVCFASGSTWVVRNHDTRSVEVKHVLDEIEREPGEAVAVGNHKRAEAALTRESKNLAQTGPLPVESGADILDDVGCTIDMGVQLEEVLTLPAEVAALFGGGDAAVDVGSSISARVLLLRAGGRRRAAVGG